ncbi:MAG: hypothetical protein BWY66_01368 [bacterium ADurb.Bin374]|nr:MAG: hypothetical protein BWY66_01368 [bacterium ADurb.Bin374]
MPVAFERSCQFREPRGELPRNTGRTAARIETERVDPDRAKPGANVVLRQVPKRDAERRGVGEGQVGFPNAGEVGEQLEGVSDIDDDQKRRPAFRRGQGAGIQFGLSAGHRHRPIPCRALPHGGSLLQTRLRKPEIGRCFRHGSRHRRVASLFGFEHETAALVQVDAPDTLIPAVIENNGFFKHIGVVSIVRLRRLGPENVEQVTQLGQKQGIVRPFRRPRRFPPRNERIDIH